MLTNIQSMVMTKPEIICEKNRPDHASDYNDRVGRRGNREHESIGGGRRGRDTKTGRNIDAVAELLATTVMTEIMITTTITITI
uniref:Uncharacterized protein n=1 Tax=Romanomermis culicivorax TaxID=13658 RepID=A0A915IKC8_ROMCU